MPTFAMEQELTERGASERDQLQQRLLAEAAAERQQLGDAHASEMARLRREREISERDLQAQIDKQKLMLSDQEVFCFLIYFSCALITQRL